MSHCRVLPPGEFNGMLSQSHISHCRVLPLGEFTVMIPEPHATLQGAVTWRNQCHDRATLQGVIIPSAILKCHILFFWFFKCSLGFDEHQSHFLTLQCVTFPVKWSTGLFSCKCITCLSALYRRQLQTVAPVDSQ